MGQTGTTKDQTLGQVRARCFGSLILRVSVIFSMPAATRPRIQLAKAIAQGLLLRSHLGLRSNANRSSKAPPLYNRPAAQVKAPKQDSKPAVRQDSPIADDRRWLPKNIGGRSSSNPAPRHRYRPILAGETANLRDA